MKGEVFADKILIFEPWHVISTNVAFDICRLR